MARSGGPRAIATDPPDPPNLNYVPARSGPDSGPVLGLALFLLTLLIWMLSAR
jgi:hypothetical protein